MRPDVADRFWSKVRLGQLDECWTWMGERNRGGYGRARIDGKKTVAHRLAYVALVGAVPSGKQLDHLCRNRACVNPRHLEPVSASVNAKRGSNGDLRPAITTCKRGHEYDRTDRANRGCHACRIEQQREKRRARGGRAGERRLKASLPDNDVALDFGEDAAA